MSSILDALEKLERSRPPALEPPPTPPPPRRGRIALLVGAAIGTGAALALTLLLARPGDGPTEPPASGPEVTTAHADAPPERASAPAPSPPAAAPEPVSTPPPEPVAPAPVAQPDAAPAAVPEAQAAPGQAQPPAAPAPPTAGSVLAAAPPVPPPAANAPRPWAQPATPEAPAVRQAPPPVAMASARRPDDPEPPPIRHAPAGAPDVRLSFLLFSPSAERRSVALAIDGASLQTLHEGESAGDLQVVRILPDRVDLRWQGEAYTVRARD